MNTFEEYCKEIKTLQVACVGKRLCVHGWSSMTRWQDICFKFSLPEQKYSPNVGLNFCQIRRKTSKIAKNVKNWPKWRNFAKIGHTGWEVYKG